jgi:putative oxidoreductase
MAEFRRIGCLLLALPMVVYGFEHFIYADFVATIVPPWIPWHMFWVYFCGVALFAAGLSILVNKHARLAAALLGTMIFLWVLTIHVFLIFHKPGDAWADRRVFGDLPGRLNNAFKDLGLSGAAFICAGAQSESAVTDKLFAFGRSVFAASIFAFGVLHFAFPAFAPGIPPMFTNITFFIPGHLFWVSLTGAVFLGASVCIMLGEAEWMAASWLAITILLFDLLTWVPRFRANPSEIWGNWLKDIGLAGGALILARALPRKAPDTHPAGAYRSERSNNFQQVD